LAKIILFLISPFIASVYSVKTLNRKSSYLVFFLFAVFFGLSFSVPSGKTAEFTIDGAAYRDWFEKDIQRTSADFNDKLTKYLSFKGREIGANKDFFFDTASFYISRLTDNYHVMFMFFAAIFAFFALKSFRFFTQEIDFKIGIAIYILTYLFFFNQIFNINGLRFFMAAWIGVYCVFQIFRNENKRFFLLLAFIPIIHVSFWVFTGIVLLAYFFMKYDKFWIALFFISFVFSSLSVEILNSNIDFLPSILKSSAKHYASEEYIEKRSSGSGSIWITRVVDFLIRVYITYLIYLFIKNKELIKNNPKSKNVFLFLLVFMTFINFAMPIPSLGNRYVLLSYPLIAYVWLVSFKNIQYRNVLYLLPLVFCFQIYNQFLVLYPKVLEFDFFVSNPFYLIYIYLNT
jgi:hypothetical protein